LIAQLASVYPRAYEMSNIILSLKEF
jgi:hypothetical protein